MPCIYIHPANDPKSLCTQVTYMSCQAGAKEENKEGGLEAAVASGKKRRTKWLTAGLEV
jgi:hypothetical protein